MRNNDMNMLIFLGLFFGVIFIITCLIYTLTGLFLGASDVGISFVAASLITLFSLLFFVIWDN